MKKIQHLRLPMIMGVSALLVVGTAACASSNQPSTADPNAKVTITVGDQPTTDSPATRAAFNAQVKAFEKANPNITIKPTTTIYNAQTFQTLLAGGNLPDAMQVPFTEPQGLIAKGQIANITPELKQLGLDKVLNASTLAIVQDKSKQDFGIPISAYAVGLNYNRALFKKAGLDPNKPPTTWAQVATDAAKITKATGETGYGQMSNNNCGGWMLTAMTYAFGGRIENAAGTKAIFADSAATSNALKALHNMKWNDNVMGTNNLYDCTTMVTDFAAGKVGMYLKAPDDYTNLVVQYKMSPADFGAALMPSDGGKDNTTLTGGASDIFNPKATAAQKLAAVKWVNYAYVQKYTNKATAISLAKAASADGAPAAVPGLPIVSPDAYNTYFKWIAPYNNVPLANFAPYTSGVAKETIAPEPTNSAQTVYATLDSLIQNVLTNQGADIKSLVSTAQSSVTNQLSQ
jgi:multiple sugar transport system substrate-binding protein